MKIALVGSPNSGKTTLYNWLTGLSAKAVNYPGSTVEIGRGAMAAHWGQDHLILDTPGIYGFYSGSEDEKVTRRVLGEGQAQSQGEAELIVAVLDGTQLDRQLILFEQLKKMGLSPIPVITMADLMTPDQAKNLKRALESAYGQSFHLIDGRLGGGLPELIAAFSPPKAPLYFKDAAWTEKDFEQARQHIHRILTGIQGASDQNAPMVDRRRQTQQIDRWLLHPLFGLPLLIGVMTLIFTSVFLLAQPLMDGIDRLFVELAKQMAAGLGSGELSVFVTEGVLPGFAAFLVFVPQIAILFLALAVLEASGYLARSVVLVDQMFSRLGLTGRSLVPILVGFACAVPAMMATRTIASRRDRWLTLAILPLMTCSARLPVFGLLLGFLLVDSPAVVKGLAMAGLYFLSLILGGVAALVLNRLLPRSELSPLAIELPLYRRPSARLILRQTWGRVRSFIERAAPVIFVLSLLIWFLSHFPEGAGGSTPLGESYLGKIGHWIEPLFRPMGADWRVGVGILSAFAAREVFVSTLAMILNSPGGERGEADPVTLMETLRTVTAADGSPLFTVASVSALLIFFVVALQCLSTVAISARESRSWRFALGQLLVLNFGAYLMAVFVFQSLHALGY